MSSRQHYPKPPIREAILEIRPDETAALSLELLGQVSETLAASHPKKESVYEQTGHFEFVPGGPTSASASQDPAGVKLTSSDDREVIHLLKDRFAFSRLAPYESWETFRDTARHLWKPYRERMATGTMKRIAVRYVNRIDIPGERVNLDEYFRTRPEAARDLPGELGGFLLRLKLSLPEIRCESSVNQLVVPPLHPGMFSVVLDIDLFRSSELPPDDAGVWELFEVLHDWKNRLFEACITNATRELFR